MYNSLEIESTSHEPTPRTKWAAKKRGFLVAVVILGLVALVALGGSFSHEKWSVATREAVSAPPNPLMRTDDHTEPTQLGNEVEDLSTPEVVEADLPEEKEGNENLKQNDDDEDEDADLEDVTAQSDIDGEKVKVVSDHHGWDRCTKLVGGTSRPTIYGHKHYMWKGHGPRKKSVYVRYGGWRLRGGKSRVMSFLSGFDIGTGPNTRIRIGAKPLNLKRGKVTVHTWADTRVWASQFGYLATSLPKRKFAMTTVTTCCKPIQWNHAKPQTRSRIVRLPCKRRPKVFAALNWLDVTHTRTINTRLKIRSWATKLKRNRVRLSVKFETWANSKIYAAGAAVAAWCPRGVLGAHVESGLVTFHGGSGNRMWNGNGVDTETRYVRFRRIMHCWRPQVAIGLTAIDFGRNKNYRLFVSAANVNDLGFNVIFKSWADTQLWWAQASWVAICPQ